MPQVVNVQVRDARRHHGPRERMRDIAASPRPPIGPREYVGVTVARAEVSQDRQGDGAQGDMLHLSRLRLSQRRHLGRPVNVSPPQIAAFAKP